MSTLRRSPFPPILWLMLVVFLTIGVLDVPQALAKRDLQCGVVDVEGDPSDGVEGDISGSGSSSSPNGEGNENGVFSIGFQPSKYYLSVDMFALSGVEWLFFPIEINGSVSFHVVIWKVWGAK